MNERYNTLLKNGYRYTGIVMKDWDKEEAIIRAAELRIDGTKAEVVLKIEVSQFRGGEEKTRWWVVLEKPSEVTLAKRKAAQEAKNLAYKQYELRKIADGWTLEDLAWMIKDKVDRMSPKELLD